VRYEAAPVHLELRGHRLTSTASESQRVWVGIFNRGPDGQAEALRPVFEAVAVFADSAPVPPPATPWILEDPRPSRFTAESLYGEQWLFHGPPFQALVRVGSFSDQGIEGILRVLPWEPLLKRGIPARLHSDVIVLDSFTHLLGCWGLDDLAEGDVVFPLRMETLQLHGDRPPVGTEVACRIAIREVQRHHVRVDAEIIRPDGTVWMRLVDWEDWRFHWPSRFRDVMRQPRDIFVGEELALEDPISGPIPEAKAVWLAPPADMGRPIWRDVLEQTQLGPAERAAHLALAAPERRRAHRLWGRIAAKEAARRLGLSLGEPATYPADLAVVTEERGRPRLIRVQQPEDHSLPAISIAHANGVSVALAARDPAARIGVDVESIADRPDGFEAAAFAPGERAILSGWSGPARSEWIARFWSAKEAAVKATGTGLAGTEVIHADAVTGMVLVRLAPQLTAAGSGHVENPLRVVSARRGDYAWAWTLGEGVER
jgi:phosphopantetheinyl transferase